jgi:RHS repeat-associated protein
MPQPYKYLFLSILFCSWASSGKGHNSEDTYESVFSDNRYEISVENGDTIYRYVPEIWDLRPATEDKVSKKTSGEPSKVLSYGGGYMDLSHIPESYAVDKSKDIGEIAINQQSINGALGYSVPIEAYRATSGVNPNIQLVYNSMSGNGVAGYGWQIGGLSVIAAVNSNYYFDGKPAPAKGDVSGTFVLDGQRLINLNTGNSSEKYFQTEQGFIKVTAYLTGTIIKYFKVYYPNGSIATYGYEGNSGKKVIYPLTKVTDISGNIINYTYTETNNAYYVSEINYGGREGSNPISNHAKISFSYENRNDYATSYIDGLGISQTKRLKNITAYFNGQLLRTYNLTYTNVVSSMLTQIDCMSNGKSLNPLRFYYGENNQLTGFDKNSLILTSYFNNASAPDLILTKGKFDTYSYDDGLISYPNFNTYGVLVIKKFLGIPIAYKYGSTYSPNQSLLVYADLPSGLSIPVTLTAESGFQLLSAMDIDGNGKDELVKMNSVEVNSSSEKIRFKIYDVVNYLGGVYLSTRDSFDVSYGGVVQWSDLYSPSRKAVLTGDFWGNGKQTILTITYNKNIKDEDVQSRATLIDFDNKSTSALFDKDCFSLYLTDQVFVMDFDGDGKADICRKTSGSTRIYSFDVNTGDLIEIASFGLINTTNREMLLGDLNGDGMTDIVVSPEQGSGNTWTVYYSTGTSSGFEMQTISSAAYGTDTKFILQDMNGDGKPDLVVNNDGTLQIYSNINGLLSNTPESQTVSVTGGAQAFLIPGNVESGYKMSQLFSIYNHELDAITFNHNLSTEQLLTGVVTSTGIVNKHQYASILNGYNSIYDKGTACSYPYRGLSGNVYLHAYAERFLSGKRIAATSAHYTRGMIDLRGKGFLGFGQVQVYDEIRNTTTTQVFNPVNFGIMTSLDSPIASATFNYNVSVATNKIAKVTLNTKTETDKLANISVSSTYSYDSYGNPTYEYKNYGNGLTTTTNNLYHNQTGTPYKLGMLYQQTVTSSRNGQSSTEKMYIPAFDSSSKLPLVVVKSKNNNNVYEVINTYQNGLITKESHKSFTATTRIETSYSYDSFGRLSRKTNPLGLYEDYDYDTKGRLASITDHKNNITEFSYDSWGRKISTTMPDGVTKTVNLQWIDTGGNGQGTAGLYGGTGDEYDQDMVFCAPMGTGGTIAASNSITLSPGFSFSAASGGNLQLWIDRAASVSPPPSGSGSSAEGDYMYLVTSRAIGAPATQRYINALGREVRTGSMRFDGNYLYVDKEYDDYGRLSQVSLPFKSGLPGQWNTYTYDAHDRLLSLSYASGKTDTYSYSGLSVTSTIDGVTKTTTRDATGKVISVSDPAGTITYNLRPDGQPSSIVAPGNITTSFLYDIYGRQTDLIDPSAGTLTYTYDAAGNRNSETDNRGKVTNTNYDAYNRPMLKEVVGELITNYTYNSDGQLDTISSNNGTAKIYAYDGLMRMTSEKEIVPDGKFLQKVFNYSTGVTSSISYSTQNGALATEHYNYAYGTLTEIKLNNTISVWKLTGENDMGLATEAVTGSLTREYGYDSFGFPTSRTVKHGSATIQNFGYNIDSATGNLNWRKDNTRNLQENFAYDNLNRLTGFGGNTISYDVTGNITNHTAIGSFAYENTDKPYAVTTVTPYGTAIPLRDQDISYNGMQRPDTISENGFRAILTYNDGGNRVKMHLSHNGTTQLTRYYIGGRYELDSETGTERLYLGGDAYSAASVYVKEAGNWKIYYICRDYLGSITHVVNADGSLKQELSYDPWGRLRNPATQQVYAVGSESILFLGRGYTGHEHLTVFGLINMNARLYDPALGRFLSPDPYVQEMEFSQNFNRYSYCLNNPLRYTDPNGKFILRALLGLAGTIMSPFIFIGNLLSGQSVKNSAIDAWNSGPVSWWNFGARIENGIFGKQIGGYQHGITGQPGQTTPYGTLYSPTIGAQNCSDNFYMFDNLHDMVNFIYNKSNDPTVNVEIVGYVLKDEAGNIYYYVLDWNNGINTNSMSSTPYYTSTNPDDQRPKFDGKYIVAQIHSHPTSYYENNNNSNGYDGSSYLDYQTAVNMGVPVYSIGPTSVSVITNKSEYKTADDFEKLSLNSYGFSKKPDARRKTNPFYLSETKTWLENPVITMAW